jgi:GWxTD domain-containing protein
MTMRFRLFLIACLLAGGSLDVAALQSHPNQTSRERSRALRQEERQDYYQKWLNEDVVYLISDEERAVFEKLANEEEKEQFIEQFWHRRDPDVRTPANEFKEEHYRRIAYANEWFTSATPGWKTDRGRIYIIHGPPDQVDRRAAGGPYIRTTEEGGGSTTTYPFEKWWYRNMEGLGAVELEFVDPTYTGEYRLALGPFEKDALKNLPGVGLTAAELEGEVTKADRPYFYGGAYPNRFHYTMGAETDPFRQWEKFIVSQKPRPIQYQDLKEQININISYASLPFRVRTDYFRLDSEQVLVPVTVELDNKELTFKEELGRQVAKVAFYGVVTSITNRLVLEFDDDVTTAFSPERTEQALRMGSTYQKILALEGRMRYKLDLIVKDLNSGKIGVIRQAIIPPSFPSAQFQVSSLVLADMIFPVSEVPAANEMFLLGNVKVRPRVDRTFTLRNPLGVYLQVYNAAIDQTSLSPSLQVRYRLMREGETVMEVFDSTGESIQYASEQRIVLIRGFPTDHLAPGRYEIEVEVTDKVGGAAVSARDSFHLSSLRVSAVNAR